MSRIKIGVVEDEMVIADTICLMLRKIGYDATTPAATYPQAMQMIERERPDLLLLDIQLAGSKDGIDVALKVREILPIPVIFLTANSDADTITRAKTAKPNAYLVKPFTREDLFAAIEIAISNFNAPGATALMSPEYILLKDGYRMVKLFHHEILYLENEGNYIIFHTTDKRRIMVRGTMPDMLALLPADKFVRNHRSFSVNLLHLKMAEAEELILKGELRLPLASVYKGELMKRWK